MFLNEKCRPLGFPTFELTPLSTWSPGNFQRQACWLILRTRTAQDVQKFLTPSTNFFFSESDT